MIEITIPGQPIAWERARRNGNRYFDIQKKKKLDVGWIVRSQYKGKPLEGPLIMNLWSYLEKPPTTKFEDVPYGKPDCDNLEKFVLDVLTGIIYKDDCQIVDVNKKKRWAVGIEPQTIIQIEHWHN